MNPKVAEIVNKSRATTASYSLFSSNRVTLEYSDPVEEWGAEFHHGSLH